MPERQTQVLVVGGSLVGLTTSVLLASYGIPHVVVESHHGTAIHPRAASFHQRTMEVFRSAGLQAAVEEVAAREFRQGGAIVAVESLAGKELAYFYRSYNDGVEGLSPADRLFITQVGLEPVLRQRATELGAEHLFGTDLVSFEDRVDKVAAVIRPRDGGPEQTVIADYLVAADGAHSAVRERLGIPMSGRGSFADCVTIYFRADVNPFMGERNLSVVYVNHPELMGFFRFSYAGDSGFLAVFATLGPGGARNTHVGEGISDQLCADLVRTALGSEPGLPVEIESVQRWSAMAATAGTFQRGRVFLAGDAAHVMPPTGGFGGNTGVADAHNLAWKLAYVTQGTAGSGLLDTYTDERRPISELTVEQAYTRYALRVDPSLPRDDLRPPLDDPAIELGSIYRSSAVHADPDDPAQELDDPHARTWTAGARVPHLPLAGGNGSTLDAAAPGFALITGEGNNRWQQAADQARDTLGVTVTVHQVSRDAIPALAGPADPAAGAPPGSGWTGAALIRPDGVIAWKPAAPAAGATAQLTPVLAALLSRPAP
jgi:2-polyprenyl-6-methoxyphenol hydroxylase-like FAD-dependent oxidoreductase